MREMRYEEAIVLYRRLVEMHPSEDSYLFSLAWAYHDNGQLAESVGCFERILEKELVRQVFTGFAFDELVRIYKAEKMHDRLIDVCERAAASHPDDTGILTDLGDAYLRAGRAADAVAVFEKLVDMGPDSSVHVCLLGNAYVAAGAFDRAEEVYSRACAIDPSETPTFIGRLTDEFVKAGNLQGAERVLRKCLSCRSDVTFIALQLGDVMIEEGKPDEAMDVYEAVIARDRQSAGAYCNRLGNALAKACYHSRAIAAFRRAVAAEPDNPFYRVRLADACAALGLPVTAAEPSGINDSPKL